MSVCAKPGVTSTNPGSATDSRSFSLFRQNIMEVVQLNTKMQILSVCIPELAFSGKAGRKGNSYRCLADGNIGKVQIFKSGRVCGIGSSENRQVALGRLIGVLGETTADFLNKPVNRKNVLVKYTPDPAREKGCEVTLPFLDFYRRFAGANLEPVPPTEEVKEKNRKSRSNRHDEDEPPQIATPKKDKRDKKKDKRVISIATPPSSTGKQAAEAAAAEVEQVKSHLLQMHQQQAHQMQQQQLAFQQQQEMVNSAMTQIVEQVKKQGAQMEKLEEEQVKKQRRGGSSPTRAGDEESESEESYLAIRND
jgi:hypothetical protein